MLRLDVKKLILLQAKECLNNSELSERANIPRTTISKIINGKRNASTKTIGLLAKAFNVEVTELIVNEN